MTILGHKILTAEIEIRDDAAELFFTYFLDRSVENKPNLGVAAFHIKHRPTIRRGEKFIRYHFLYDGEEMITNYGMYAYRVCVTYDIYPQFFKSELIDTTQLITKIRLKEYETLHK